MKIDDELRADLIEAGWVPPMTEDDYEAWRPALLAFRLAMDWNIEARTPLDKTDREMIDKLRSSFALAPKGPVA